MTAAEEANSFMMNNSKMNVDGREPLAERIRSDPKVVLKKYIQEIFPKEFEAWFDVATIPLNESIRVNACHPDAEWVRIVLKHLGGTELDWFTDGWVFSCQKREMPPYISKWLKILHTTGRITSQEIVSMMPVLILNPQPDELVLDLCAAPGSKATQIAEHTQNRAAIIANDPIKKRLNTLATNRARLAHSSLVLTSSDGRYFPRVPQPGFNKILVDVPCSGTGTVRKNPDIWWNWSPDVSKKMHMLQIRLAQRSAKLLSGGGRMVYSTCSLDPLENEAVVADLLRTCPWLEVEEIPKQYWDAGMKNGMQNWDLYSADICALKEQEVISRFPPSMWPPTIGTSQSELRTNEKEEWIQEQLKKCGRIWNQDIEGGGFFIASLRSTEPLDNIAVGLGHEVGQDSEIIAKKELHDHHISKMGSNHGKEVLDAWGFDPFSDQEHDWWIRGRRMHSTPSIISERLWEPEVVNAEGKMHAGKQWHPLRIEHVGSLGFYREKNGCPRPARQFLDKIRGKLLLRHFTLGREALELLLKNGSILVEKIEENVDKITSIERGSILLSFSIRGNERSIPGFLGERITPLINSDERMMLLALLEEECNIDRDYLESVVNDHKSPGELYL